MRVKDLTAHEVLDSGGRPTLEVAVTMSSGTVVTAGVPAGASKGSREAVELRDGDPSRYGGRGVLQAVGAVTGPIAELVIGREWATLTELDEAMCTAEGTRDKSRWGANAIVGVSMAAARAFAAAADLQLYRYLTPDGVSRCLPVPHFNVLNGGAHAPNPLAFQEFMIAPVGAPNIGEAVRAGAEVYSALRYELAERSYATGIGDEGGFAPDMIDPGPACALIVAAVDAAGYGTGPDGVMLALDPAANGFTEASGRYRVAERMLSSADLVEFYAELVDRYPIWSIEDGLAEDDHAGWRLLTERLGTSVQIVGDDLFVTDAARITAAVQAGEANAALIKLNQVGTVSETLAAVAACRRGGFTAMVSHRSGETPDSFIADLAVGLGCGQIKAGAPARGERVAKYNRLLSIGMEDPDLRYGLTDDAQRSPR